MHSELRRNFGWGKILVAHVIDWRSCVFWAEVCLLKFLWEEWRETSLSKNRDMKYWNDILTSLDKFKDQGSDRRNDLSYHS